MRHPALSITFVLAALLACKKEEQAAPTPAAEAPAAQPAAPAAAPPAATPAAPPAATAEPLPQAKTGMPTEGNSKPPTVAEWNAVGEITVRHSTPLNCETKLVREWLRVSCRSDSGSKHKIQSVTLTNGNAPGGIPPFVKAGTVASIVMQVKKNVNVQYTFDWGTFARRLTVQWPNGAPSPSYEFDASAP
ncbi:MAG: hypothetical protein IT376_00675 [Polyangiaceae bacterium]|nr:hypothetical protein [Polyangiaceae bacterium]